MTTKGSTMKRVALASGIAAVALTLAACGSGESTATSGADASAAPPAAASTPAPKTEAPASAASKAASPAAVAGSYISYDTFSANTADFVGGDVVLFFNASWCPTCQEAQRNLEASGVPEGLTVVKVDYDSSSDLRKKYGVTIQHTFVQIDEEGNKVAKWTGSSDGSEIASKTV
jgi:thiol-disulfide isomerase/thioredoxin